MGARLSCDSAAGSVPMSVRLNFETANAAPYLAFTQGKEALPPQALAEITVLGGGCVWTLSPTWGVRLDYS